MSSLFNSPLTRSSFSPPLLSFHRLPSTSPSSVSFPLPRSWSSSTSRLRVSRAFESGDSFAGSGDSKSPNGTLLDEDEDAASKNVANEGDIIDSEDISSSVVMASLQSYKQALVNEDQSTIAEIEAFLQSIEDDKNALSSEVAALSAELSAERERVLRISADFDNFRKRTERERLSLMTNAQGEVVESLLPVLDNFERAKSQIKVETEEEGKINNSYQSISKQFLEILTALGVEAVQTVGSPFDPLLHEAIMREESTENEEGIILEEFRKGFKLGERLIRPSMVKVSAGPGPAKPEGDNSTEPPADASQQSGEGVEEKVYQKETFEESTEESEGSVKA